jgi:signal transduction histidine kinase
LGLIGFLFYNQQKLKNRQLQKENELKDALIKIETQNRLQEQRLRISRDLHDNIGAQLTFIISSIDNLKYGFDIEDKKLTNKLETISEFTTATIYELRDTIWAMNKTEISLEDLQSRISNFIDKAGLASDGIDFNFKSNTSEIGDLKFSSVEGMNIYRIIQESINNALKYSEAKHIGVHFSSEVNTLVFKILDDGKGFDIQNTQMGNGINNMKKRAHDIAAYINVSSKIDKGTQVVLKINHS